MDELTKDIIVGRNPVLEALRSDAQISRILISKGKREGTIKVIIALAKENNVLIKEVAVAKLDGICNLKNHQGVIAYISPIKYVEIDDILNNAYNQNEDPFIVMLDGIEDVHNLGAIARSAEAAGAHGLIVQKHRAAPITPMAVKASSGALMHLPVSVVTNLSRTIDYLKEKGLWTAGTHQEAKQEYYKANLKGPMLIIIGSEGKGISRLVSTKCDFMLSIPMKGKVTSLNASAAAAIIIFEVVKQRLNNQ